MNMASPRTALITGITGQDGSYLAGVKPLGGRAPGKMPCSSTTAMTWPSAKSKD